MKRALSVRPLARSDIKRYFAYIGEDSPMAAARFLAAVERTMQLIADHPLASPAHEAASPELRGLRKRPIKGFPNHVVFFFVRDHGDVSVVRVLHAAMDHDSALEFDARDN